VGLTRVTYEGICIGQIDCHDECLKTTQALIGVLAAPGSKSATSGGSDSVTACIEALAALDSRSTTSGGSDSVAACIEALSVAALPGQVSRS
jgi:hypothetical protein